MPIKSQRRIHLYYTSFLDVNCADANDRQSGSLQALRLSAPHLSTSIIRVYYVCSSIKWFTMYNELSVFKRPVTYYTPVYGTTHSSIRLMDRSGIKLMRSSLTTRQLTRWIRRRQFTRSRTLMPMPRGRHFRYFRDLPTWDRHVLVTLVPLSALEEDPEQDTQN